MDLEEAGSKSRKAGSYVSMLEKAGKTHRLGGFNSTNLFLTLLGVGSPRSRYFSAWLLLWSLTVLESQAGHLLVSVSSQPLICIWSFLCVFLSPYKITSHLGIGPTLILLNYLFKKFLSSNIIRLEFRGSSSNFGMRDTIEFVIGDYRSREGLRGLYDF